SPGPSDSASEIAIQDKSLCINAPLKPDIIGVSAVDDSEGGSGCRLPEQRLDQGDDPAGGFATAAKVEHVDRLAQDLAQHLGADAVLYPGLPDLTGVAELAIEDTAQLALDLLEHRPLRGEALPSGLGIGLLCLAAQLDQAAPTQHADQPV